MAIGYQLIRLVSDQGVIRLSLISLTFWTLALKISGKPSCVQHFQSASDWWDHGAMSAPASRYFHGPMLGEGAYGEVYAMFHRSLGQLRWALGNEGFRVRGMSWSPGYLGVLLLYGDWLRYSHGYSHNKLGYRTYLYIYIYLQHPRTPNTMVIYPLGYISTYNWSCTPCTKHQMWPVDPGRLLTCVDLPSMGMLEDVQRLGVV